MNLAQYFEQNPADTMASVATDVGVTKGRISQIAKGDAAGGALALKLVKRCPGVTLEELLGGEPSPSTVPDPAPNDESKV
jgi:hypothetical protein